MTTPWKTPQQIAAELTQALRRWLPPRPRDALASADESADGYCGAPMSAVESVQRARARYHDPSYAPRTCENEDCGKTYTGPALYCSLECAIADSGFRPEDQPRP